MGQGFLSGTERSDCFTLRTKPKYKKKAKDQDGGKFSAETLKSEDSVEEGDAEQLKKVFGDEIRNAQRDEKLYSEQRRKANDVKKVTQHALCGLNATLSSPQGTILTSVKMLTMAPFIPPIHLYLFDPMLLKISLSCIYKVMASFFFLYHCLVASIL
uniref:Uncharacterized protein n=1 Tax=Vitis vinifera TaxID=29760 RepID=F6GU38_VITVI